MEKRLSAAPALLLAAAAAAAGCSSEAPPPSGPASASAPGPASPGAAERVVRSLREIAGEWDIARFQGYTPVRLHEGVRRAFVDIRSDALSYSIECNYSGNEARIDPAGILHDESDGSRTQTLMGCGPEDEAREAALFGFFASKPKVSRIGEGRLRMVSAGGELILETPPLRRLANIPALAVIEGRWVPQMALTVMAGNGHSGGGFQEPGTVTITGRALRYSGCGGASFDFRYTADARMKVEAERAPQACDEAAETMLLTVMRGDPMVERIAGGGIALTAGNKVVTLQSEAELRRLRDAPPPPPPAGAGQAPPPPAPPGR